MSEILVATEKPFASDAITKIKKVTDGSKHKLQILEKYTSKEELKNAIKLTEALIVRSDLIDKEIIDAGEKLRIIVRAGAGFDNIDTAYAATKNIVVMNTPGQNANAVAEYAFGMLLYEARHHFNGSTGIELKGKKLGLIGFGNIGRCMTKIAKGFGMEVYAYDVNPNPSSMIQENVTPIGTAAEIFSSCNFVSLHVPSTPQTKGSINYDLLKLLPKNSILINTARLDVINEADIIKIMEERNDISFVSDFTPKNESVFKEKFADRCFYPVKKAGAQTEEANANAGIAAARQIINFFDKGDLTFKVN
ncbi:MAG: NAD(P)-dependent oxidoreductase [Chitinophagales bacterium]|nr:3-phosphoglycerate dehydrogenase [Bacteroidota bacterium]MBK8489004.1 3-phosphoglycerate dehydrogenase [Bacteroidota bacterium]MBK8680854.1 3-phosphoglycerate dehydrogenase [Bacteroidota bacterium]MBP7262016.1 3-phosphoglycerate dehydrogenase [Bacteroidia bacterium]MBP9705892.1 3-phosphoglycerate dehydrogenase [Chitinophagales bacterium]